MIGIPCRKCDKMIVFSVTDISNGKFSDEIWNTGGPRDYCNDCKVSNKIEERNKKINNIINKKWWKF